MNHMCIAGNIGQEPTERVTPSGVRIVSFSVAVNSKKQKEESVTWYKVVIFGDRFDKMLPYLKKGSAVMVWGELRPPEIYTDKKGEQKINLEIHADSIKFSPFGKSDSSLQPVQKPIQSSGSVFQNAGAAHGTKKDEPFIEDPNLPF